MVKIRNSNIQNYIEENGILPNKTKDGINYYKYSVQLEMLLDKYFIQYICIPNKL